MAMQANGNGRGHSDEAETPASNGLTDADRQEAIRELVPLKNRMEEASGAYRACLKKWKGRGASTKALTQTVAERRLDPDETMAHEREMARMRAVSGRFPTIQQDMAAFFGEPVVVPVKAEAEHTEFRAHDDGYHTGMDGGARDDNPYEAGSPLHVKWDEGYIDGQAAIAERMAAGGGERPANRTRSRRAATH